MKVFRARLIKVLSALGVQIGMIVCPFKIKILELICLIKTYCTYTSILLNLCQTDRVIT